MTKIGIHIVSQSRLESTFTGRDDLTERVMEAIECESTYPYLGARGASLSCHLRYWRCACTPSCMVAGNPTPVINLAKDADDEAMRPLKWM